jgi:hypothetical protein
MGDGEDVDKNKKVLIVENLFACCVTGGASPESNQVLTLQTRYRLCAVPTVSWLETRWRKYGAEEANHLKRQNGSHCCESFCKNTQNFFPRFEVA